MQKFIGHDLPDEQRVSLLDANCDAIEEIGYTRRFTPEELNQMKEELAETSIELSDVSFEKKSVLERFKSREKPLLKERDTLLVSIRNKSEFVKEECYKYIDHDEKMVGYYTSDGELVSSRPIQPQEMQKTVFSINRKTGTED